MKDSGIKAKSFSDERDFKKPAFYLSQKNIAAFSNIRLPLRGI